MNETVEKKEVDWSLHNVGLMRKSGLESIIKQIERGTDNRALVERTDMVITVKAPNKRPVLSAARIDRTTWHVRAVAGLIVAKGELT